MPESSEDNRYPSSTVPLSSMIEHTILGDNIDEARIISHIKEAIALDVFGVCLPMHFVPLAKKLLEGTALKVITVIDFPLGQKSSVEKANEAIVAKKLGADEIDMVLDYRALCNKNYDKAFSDLKAVVDAIKPLPIKVIVETSALNRDQLVVAIALVALSGAQFIKTSTGFHEAGANAEDVLLMRSLLPDRIFIKASGGIKNYEQAMAMVKAGAKRIGASRAREILRDSLPMNTGKSCT